MFGPVEAVEDVGQVSSRDALAGVGHGDLHTVARRRGPHRDAAAIGCVPQGVYQQIGQHLGDAVRVHVHPGQAGGHVGLDRNAVGRRLRFQGGEHALDQAGGRRRHTVQGQLPGLGQGEHLQVADQPRHAQHLVVHRQQALGREPDGAVLHRLKVGQQYRDGRTQFVGDVGQQVLAQPLLLLQGGGHVVEGPGQVADLAGAAHLHPLAAVARRQAPGGLHQGIQGPGEPAGRHDAHQCGQEEGSDGRAHRRQQGGAGKIALDAREGAARVVHVEGANLAAQGEDRRRPLGEVRCGVGAHQGGLGGGHHLAGVVQQDELPPEQEADAPRPAAGGNETLHALPRAALGVKGPQHLGGLTGAALHLGLDQRLEAGPDETVAAGGGEHGSEQRHQRCQQREPYAQPPHPISSS